VTDAQGRFVWTVPPDVAWNVPQDTSPGNEALACYALPLGPGWQARVALAPHYDAIGGPRTLMEKATRRCATRWVRAGANSELAVVLPDAGWINVLVRAPDGQALLQHAVQVVVPDTFANYAGAVVYEGTTDTTGHLHLRFYPGLRRFRVFVPGVGFGSTGMVEVLPGREATAQMPPLARFARVSGTVAPSLIRAGAYVSLDDSFADEHKWYNPHAVVDEQGHFMLDGVLPGEHLLTLVGSQQPATAISLMVSPGEQVTGLVLSPPSTDNKSMSFNPRPLQTANKAETAKPLVHGRVTDVTGKPIAGADVYAICSYDGGIRQYQQVVAGKTGQDGTYRISDLPIGMSGPTVSLVAGHAGYPIALASAQGEAHEASATGAISTGLGAVPTTFHGDLVLPVGHPGLAVQVLRAGKPQTGVAVRLTPQSGTGLFDRFYVGSSHGPASQRVENLLEPSATTNANGEAHFTDLTPGLWNISATDGQANALDSIGRWNGGTAPTSAFNISTGIIVGSGPTRHFILSIYPQPNEVAFQVLDPKGRPLANSSVAFEYGLAVVANGASTSAKVDQQGVSKYSFEQPGLWRILTRFRDSKLESIPASAEPFYQGSAVLAVSPAQPHGQPVVIHSVRRGPGRIRVRLLDEACRPATGAVYIGDDFENARYAASINAKTPGVASPNMASTNISRPDVSGEIIFPDMASGNYQLRANYADQATAPNLGRDDEPLPTDAVLTAVKLLAPQTVVVKSNETSLVTFSPQTQGYVKGKVATPDAPSNYAMYIPYYSDMHPIVRYNRKTGEFVAGPFASGKTRLHVQPYSSTPGGPPATGQDFWVEVVGGQVTHTVLTFHQEPTTVPANNTESVLTMSGIFSSNRHSPLVGQVLMPDGKTPAWGARAALVVPQTWQPIQMARTDALGRLNVADYWYTGEAPATPPAGSPTEPVLVTWLPGSNGATVVPYVANQPPRLVLPVPIAVRGHVTVGGQPVTGLSSSFRVLAAYQGRGKLNSILSVMVTAQADGSFELAGLTPGTYEVQACRDGIWLSQSQSMVVGRSALTPLTLDIAPPGAPVLVHLVNTQGKSLLNRQLRVLRPSGPLTSALWPQTLTTDSTDVVRLEGLEVGVHQLDIAPQSAGEIRSNPAGDPAPQHTAPIRVKPFRADISPTSETIVVHD